jgi:fructokinase
LADQLGRPKEEVTSWTPYPGGAPANVATGLALLGLHALFVGALGEDELGERFMALLKGEWPGRGLAVLQEGPQGLTAACELENHCMLQRLPLNSRPGRRRRRRRRARAERGVDASAAQRNAHPTRDVLVVRGLDGDREFAGFGAAATSDYADCFLDAAALPEVALAAADVLVTGTLGLAAGSGAAVRRAVAAAKKGGKCLVVVDVNWRPVFWGDAGAARAAVLDFVAAAADVLKVSDEEAEWLFGLPAAEALAHPERVLAAAPRARGVLVSAGEKGSSYAFRAPGGKTDVTGVLPVMGVEVVDTTGAGDCYLAGFIFYMIVSGGLDALVADPAKLLRAAQFATACGAFVCRSAGAIEGQPTVREVEELLQAAGWNE